MRVGILTGGGDCPGLNAVIRGVVRLGERHYGDTFLGFQDGWRGVLEDRWRPLDVEACRGLLPKGGTIIGTSRVGPNMVEDGVRVVKDCFTKNRLDALIVIGGEGTLGAATSMAAAGLPIVGVPKTIDNDIAGTDFTFGFDTAVATAVDAIDRLHTTAESHHRVLVVEVMGRHAGWIATYAGIAGGAAEVLIPEDPFSVEELVDRVNARHNNNRWSTIVVVAEGAVPAGIDYPLELKSEGGYRPRLGGMGQWVAEQIEDRTGIETRAIILGHVQRGGSPTAHDRVLATRFGVEATEAVHDGAFGMMVALQGSEITRVPLAEATAHLKLVPQSLRDVANTFRHQLKANERVLSVGSTQTARLED